MHSIEKCEHGFIHAQCRCASHDKAVVIVSCNIASHAENQGSGAGASATAHNATVKVVSPDGLVEQ